MDLKKRYYDYAKNHTEEEFYDLYYKELGNVNSGSDYFSCEDFVRLIKKVYERKYVLSNSQMSKIETNLGKYLVYYADLSTDMKNYITHKQKVIMTFVFLVSCRNTGNEKFFMSNEKLMKLANEYRFQYLAQRFFNQNVPFNRVADEYLHYVNW